MNTADFEFYRVFLHEKSGLALTAEKIYLLDSRLTPVARKWGHDTLESLAKALRGAPDPKLVYDVVEAMTTNETLFFRDDRPFKQFRNTVMPAVLKNREKQKNLRIWSAASSTGQEPYSIAITLSEILQGLPGWKTEILATDISEAALNQARGGEYSNFEVQRGLPIQMIMKYFTQVGASWKINDNLRRMVRFETFNLLTSMVKWGTFDVIFCRNVLIYFDAETKAKVLKGLAAQLAPDGFLFLGGSETVMGLSQDLKLVPGCSGLYTLGSGVSLVSPGPAPVAPLPAQAASPPPAAKPPIKPAAPGPDYKGAIVRP